MAFPWDCQWLVEGIDLGIKSLIVFGDSALVISQIKGEWNTKHPNLIPYREHVLTLLPHFEQITFEHFPREEKQLADALATMSSMFKLNWDDEAPQISIEKMDELAHCHEINTDEVVDQPWFHEVKRYLEVQEYPEGASVNDKKILKEICCQVLPEQWYLI